MIAVASGKVEGADLSDVDRFNAACRTKADALARLLRNRHGEDGEVSWTAATDTAVGGVVVRVEWRRAGVGAVNRAERALEVE